MSVTTILIILLILMLLGAVPSWPHSREWGYSPAIVILVILLVLLLLPRL